MSTQAKWAILPAALILMGTVSVAQGQTQAVQGSGSSARPDLGSGQNGPLVAGEPSKPEPREMAVYGETRPDGSASGNQALSDTAGLNKTIDQLSRAFTYKDLGAIRQLWPTIPGKSSASLGKSFVYFKAVSRNFKAEQIAINGDTASVSGSYSGSFVNGGTSIPSNGAFHATLRKLGTGWIVASLVCD